MVELAVRWGVVVVVVVAELLGLVELRMLRPLALEPAELAFVVLVAQSGPAVLFEFQSDCW